ncbi:MAG: DNA adenine methylase [Chloroflexota bacterium]
MIAQLTLAGLAGSRIESSPRLVPFVKWPGGKSDELTLIAAAAPPLTGRLIDPFVGSGSVVLATPAEVPAWANDACVDLVRLFTSARASDASVREAMDAVALAWEAFAGLPELYAELALAFLGERDELIPRTLIGHAPAYRQLVRSAGAGLVASFDARLERDLPTKFRRMRKVQTDVGTTLSRRDLLANLEGAVRSAFYMAIRARYNEARRVGRWDPARSADFLFLREFAYAAMFRFNASDEFNVPYGGITYNRKPFADKVRAMFAPAMIERLGATEWRSIDFEPFLAESAPTSDDFVFVDPPYDSEFSAYDNAPFDARDQWRLRDTLQELPARVMVVIKDTPMIRQLYGSDRWVISEAAKTYMWTIKSRNDRSATHLTITNY